MDKIGIFTPTTLNIRIDVKQLVTLHYFRYSKNFAFGGEKHNFWEIAYVDRGEVSVVAESKGFDLKQGEAIFHKPNEYHNIWANDKYANIIILSFVSHSPAMMFFENKIIQFGEEHRKILAKILKAGEFCFQDPLNDVHQTKLNLAPSAPFACQQVIKNYLELLLIHLIQQQSLFLRCDRTSQNTKVQGDNYIAEAIQQYLIENVYNGIELEDVLQQMCFSKSYITSLFRNSTGDSIMHNYSQLKIAESQRLISEGHHSFTEIAEKLHFNSIHHFSSSFKKTIGMTPTEYKKSVQSLEVL